MSYFKIIFLSMLLFLSACSKENSNMYYVTDPLQDAPGDTKGIRFSLTMKEGKATAMWIMDAYRFTYALNGIYKEVQPDGRLIIWDKKNGVDNPQWEIKNIAFSDNFYTFNLNGVAYKLNLRDKADIATYIQK